jgi:hypothetical protein
MDLSFLSYREILVGIVFVFLIIFIYKRSVDSERILENLLQSSEKNSFGTIRLTGYYQGRKIILACGRKRFSSLYTELKGNINSQKFLSLAKRPTSNTVLIGNKIYFDPPFAMGKGFKIHKLDIQSAEEYREVLDELVAVAEHLENGLSS